MIAVSIPMIFWGSIIVLCAVALVVTLVAKTMFCVASGTDTACATVFGWMAALEYATGKVVVTWIAPEVGFWDLLLSAVATTMGSIGVPLMLSVYVSEFGDQFLSDYDRLSL